MESWSANAVAEIRPPTQASPLVLAVVPESICRRTAPPATSEASDPMSMLVSLSSSARVRAFLTEMPMSPPTAHAEEAIV